MSGNVGFVNYFRRKVLGFLLSIKALVAGLVLIAGDAFLYIRSLFAFWATKLFGIKEETQVSSWHGIPSVLTVTKEQDKDFNFWRKPTYILPTLRGIVSAKLNKLLDSKRVDILADSELINWFESSAMSRLVVRDGNELVLDTRVMPLTDIDQDVKVRMPVVRLDSTTRLPVSIAFDETVYTPKDGAHWTIAKLHFQAVTAFAVPGYLHGSVHFGLPCTVAASLEHLPKKSNLRKLLAPHFRFTIRINNEALRVQRAQDRSKPYAPFPTTGDGFVTSIVDNVKAELLTQGMQAPHRTLQLESFPYMQFGQAYYDTFKPFVKKVLETVPADEITQWKLWLARYIPGVESLDSAELVTTVIWQVSVLHSMDHYTFEHLQQGYKYFFTKPKLGHGIEEGIAKNMKDNAIVKLMVDTDDKFRMHAFISTFVKGYKHVLWDNSLANLSYKFDSKELNKDAKVLQEALIKLDEDLKAKGLGLTPLKELFQSICW